MVQSVDRIVLTLPCLMNVLPSFGTTVSFAYRVTVCWSYVGLYLGNWKDGAVCLWGMGNTQGQDTCFVGRPSTKRAVSLISYSLTFPFFFWDTKSFWTIISETSVIQIWSSSSSPSLILLWLLIIGREFWESLSNRIEFSQFSTIQVSVCEKQNTQPFTDHSYFTIASGIYYLNESRRGFKDKTFGYKIWLNVWSLNKKMFL